MSLANGGPTPYPQYSTFACAVCKRRKRKCSMELPECRSCTSRRQQCEYKPPASASAHSASPRAQHVAPQRTQRPPVALPLLPPSFPAEFFLDNFSFHCRQDQIPLQDIPLTKPLLDFAHEPRLIARLYFERVHPFFHFISNKNFYEHFPSAYAPLMSVSTILVACMKLVSWTPREDSRKEPKSTSYLVIKRTLVETDIAGLWSLQLLQAMILVSLYEIGHAIYPAAYTSIGTCTRYALALGINESLTVPIHSPEVMVLEQEEKRRAWWAIIILDRFVNSGYPKRPPTTQDPPADALLPTDDAVFDSGNVVFDRLYTVSTPADTGMGSFARLAQATYLLGRVFRHICELRVDIMHQEEGMQLNGQLQRLLEVSASENEISAATSICSSALMTLSDPNCASLHPMHLDFAKRLLKLVAEEAPSQSVRDFLAANVDYQAHPSPLLAHWTYQAAIVVLRLNAQTGEDFGKVEHLTRRLEALGQRWFVAAAYLQILPGP
ncbi:MAG: hypothetical protein LQ348_007455 [Seirophora lacunosa]|nr:MAG: hypothetical protein LQ348_007455 [Seirophora lacunosa]